MARRCECCDSASRVDIDASLAQRRQSIREIARTYNVSEDSLWRHEHTHLASSFKESQRLANALAAGRLLERLTTLDRVTMGILRRAVASGDYRVALGAIREARSTVESYAKLAVVDELESRIAALEAQDADEERRLRDAKE